MTERKHILIVGAGAIGGIYAAYLAKVADVAVLDTNRAHVEAIRKDGLRLTGRTESATELAAFASAAEMGKRRFDAAIILVKSQATEAAFASIGPALEGRPVLVTFQNGMGNEELLARISDLEVAHGVSFEAARYDGPGCVHHLVHGEDSWLGPARGKVESIAWLGELLTRSGLPTKVIADPRGAIWGEFIFNSVMNPIGAIVHGVNAARFALGGRDDYDAVAAGDEQRAAIRADGHYREDARRETRVARKSRGSNLRKYVCVWVGQGAGQIVRVQHRAARIRIGPRAVRRQRHCRSKRNVAELLEVSVVDETAAQDNASSASV